MIHAPACCFLMLILSYFHIGDCCGNIDFCTYVHNGIFFGPVPVVIKTYCRVRLTFFSNKSFKNIGSGTKIKVKKVKSDVRADYGAVQAPPRRARKVVCRTETTYCEQA